MISRLSHATVWVTNQEEAKRFYTEKLGFDVRIDGTMDNGFRWLAVGPKEQPDLQLVLMEPEGLTDGTPDSHNVELAGCTEYSAADAASGTWLVKLARDGFADRARCRWARRLD